MFDMKKHTGNDDAYKLVIMYRKDTNDYVVTGYSMQRSKGFWNSFADGAPMTFQTMEDAMASITEYPDK